MIRSSLLLIFISLPLFLLVDLLSWMTVPVLPNALAVLGAVILLSGFLLLVIAGLIGIGKLTVFSVTEFFSFEQRLQRQLWFTKTQKDNLIQLFHFKTIRIGFINELNRKHLLKRNNQKHLRLLSQSIKQELIASKTKLSTNAYQILQQDFVRFRNQQDIEALLQLQQKISKLV